MGLPRSWLVLGLLVGALPLRAAAGDVPDAGPLPPPLHPTAITGTYRDRPCVVVAVHGNSAVIESQGAEVRLPSTASLDPVRAKAFLPGSIEIKGQTATAPEAGNPATVHDGGRHEGGASPMDAGGAGSATGEYEATIVASQAYPRCFLVLVGYDPDYVGGRHDSSSATLTLQEIGDVPAGAETRIKAELAHADPRQRSPSYLPLIFSHGMEIRTNLADEAARYFRRGELLHHKAMVEKYLANNERVRMPARPYLRFPPVFPPRVDRAAIPARVKVDFMVTSEGTVEDVELPKGLAPDVRIAIARAVGGWLFMPKLADGQPIGIELSMELTFAD